VGGRSGHATERRHRRSPAAEQDGQQASGDGQADALGLSGAGELGLALRVAADDLGELVIQLGDAVVKALRLLEQLLESWVVVGASDGVEDLGVVAVESLSGGTAQSCALADVAVMAVEDGGGVGDAKFGG
jgi:hypothetical protein